MPKLVIFSDKFSAASEAHVASTIITRRLGQFRRETRLLLGEVIRARSPTL